MSKLTIAVCPKGSSKIVPVNEPWVNPHSATYFLVDEEVSLRDFTLWASKSFEYKIDETDTRFELYQPPSTKKDKEK